MARTNDFMTENFLSPKTRRTDKITSATTTAKAPRPNKSLTRNAERRRPSLPPKLAATEAVESIIPGSKRRLWSCFQVNTYEMQLTSANNVKALTAKPMNRRSITLRLSKQSLILAKKPGISENLLSFLLAVVAIHAPLSVSSGLSDRGEIQVHPRSGEIGIR